MRATEMTDDTALTVTHDDAANRYELHEGDTRLGLIDYTVTGDVIDMHHTEVDPSQQGRGLGGRLVRGALDDARARGLRVVPTCPFVATWIERHPDYADLVASR
jgi:uncharacterized protein